MAVHGAVVRALILDLDAVRFFLDRLLIYRSAHAAPLAFRNRVTDMRHFLELVGLTALAVVGGAQENVHRAAGTN